MFCVFLFFSRLLHVHHRASKNKDPHNHSHLTFRVEPSKERLSMPSLWQKEVVVVVTTVPDLPDFWECRLSPDNRPYYVNHAAQTTQWFPPWEIPYAPVLTVPPVVCDCPPSHHCTHMTDSISHTTTTQHTHSRWSSGSRSCSGRSHTRRSTSLPAIP